MQRSLQRSAHQEGTYPLTEFTVNNGLLIDGFNEAATMLLKGLKARSGALYFYVLVTQGQSAG
jgi:hypothetical protein